MVTFIWRLKSIKGLSSNPIESTIKFFWENGIKAVKTKKK